jgi:hypothetical protein
MLTFSHKYKSITPKSVMSIFAAALTIACSGCASNTPLPLAPIATPLPDLKRTSTDGMMQPSQQQKAIADMTAKKAEQEAQAIKTIEKSR